jgi:hypothetical protein
MLSRPVSVAARSKGWVPSTISVNDGPAKD